MAEGTQAMNSLTGLWWVRKHAPKEDVSTIWGISESGAIRDLFRKVTGKMEIRDECAIIRWDDSNFFETLHFPISNIMRADSGDARNCATLKRLGNITDKFFWRDRLETDIADRCNYSCKNCNHLSPFYRQDRYSFEEWRSDIAIAEGFVRTEIFNLLGGEPFLLKNLSDYVRVLKESPICNRIGVYTNGALLPHLKDLSVLADVDEIVISQYPSVDTKPLEKWLAAYRDRFQCKIIVNRIDTFHVFFDENRHSPERAGQAWRICTDKQQCHTIYRGRYYLCPTSNKFKYLLKEKYSVSEDLEDGFPLEGGLDGLQQFADEHGNREPLKTCFYCNFKTGTVEPHSQVIQDRML